MWQPDDGGGGGSSESRNWRNSSRSIIESLTARRRSTTRKCSSSVVVVALVASLHAVAAVIVFVWTAASRDGSASVMLSTTSLQQPAGERKPQITLSRIDDDGHANTKKKIGVYVYENISELDFTPLIQCYRDRFGGASPWQDERADMVQDMGEIWMHR